VLLRGLMVVMCIFMPLLLGAASIKPTIINSTMSTVN
jgi:hypothetical protein